MTDSERKVWFSDYCRDLADKSDAQLAYACRRYRQNSANRFFPTPGQLLELCDSPFHDDAPVRSEGRVVDGKWQPWGGACQCRRCVEKIPREGFYKAPKEFAERMNWEREQLEQWQRNRIGPSKLDADEMYARRMLVDELVRGGMDSESARTRVMIERTAMLYPKANATELANTYIGKTQAEKDEGHRRYEARRRGI